MVCSLEVTGNMDFKQLKSIHSVYCYTHKSQMFGKILGDGEISISLVTCGFAFAAFCARC